MGCDYARTTWEVPARAGSHRRTRRPPGGLRIVEGIERNSSVAGLRLDVGCSIGVALAFPGGSDAKTLLRHADAAMYRSADQPGLR
jgi:GGDEF domain-containing protein